VLKQTNLPPYLLNFAEQSKPPIQLACGLFDVRYAVYQASSVGTKAY